MSDLHERFRAWLTDGAPADLPRDAALHASACESCGLLAAAFDALLVIDVGAATPPLDISSSPASWWPVEIRRNVVVTGAVVLMAVVVGIGAAGLLGDRFEFGGGLVSSSPDGEGVLGGGGAPQPISTSPSPSSTARASASPATSDGATVSSVAQPSLGSPITSRPPVVITPPGGSPSPLAPPTASPTATLAPSIAPSAEPTDSPNPPPSEEPSQPPASDPPASEGTPAP